MRNPKNLKDAVFNSILNPTHREEIDNYLKALATGHAPVMSERLRQIRLRAKRIDLNAYSKELNSVDFEKFLKEANEDVERLRLIAELKIPTGRIGKNLKARIIVVQPQSKSLYASLTVGKRQDDNAEKPSGEEQKPEA